MMSSAPNAKLERRGPGRSECDGGSITLGSGRGTVRSKQRFGAKARTTASCLYTMMRIGRAWKCPRGPLLNAQRPAGSRRDGSPMSALPTALRRLAGRPAPPGPRWPGCHLVPPTTLERRDRHRSGTRRARTHGLSARLERPNEATHRLGCRFDPRARHRYDTPEVPRTRRGLPPWRLRGPAPDAAARRQREPWKPSSVALRAAARPQRWPWQPPWLALSRCAAAAMA